MSAWCADGARSWRDCGDCGAVVPGYEWADHRCPSTIAPLIPAQADAPTPVVTGGAA